MSRINSAYPSLIAGVSQLPEASRQRGQLLEQVNMVSDEVRGLTRRNGSVQASATVAASAPLVPATLTDAAAFASTRFQVDGTQFSVHYRTRAATPGSSLPGLTVVNDATGAQLTINRQPVDAGLDALLSGGVRAVAALGRFVLFSGNTLPVTYSTTENFLIEENQQRHVAWVRGGAYSRTYRIGLIRGNNKFVIEYTTPSASYPDPLDTSDILATDPDYLKKVNDRTNAYNSAVTRWAGDALANSSPEAIAARLAAELQSSGFLSPSGVVEAVGSSVVITDSSFEDIEVDDGGDQSLMVAAGNTVKSVETLTSIGYPGKVVRVRAQDGADAVAFYMKAVAKDGSSGRFTEVAWEEAAGTTFLPTGGLVFGTVIGSTFHVASSPAGIRALTGLPFADYQPSRAGDIETNRPPEFLRNARIDMLTVFQDRVLIGSRNAINTSATGDYLNFFRPSVVTVAASDPVNFSIIGGEEDTLRKALMFDLNLVLFGDARQYVISGRRPFVPGQVAATTLASLPNAAAVQPVNAENYMMFVRANGGAASLHRFRPGEVDGSPVVDELSEELDTYLEGAPVDLQVHTTPNFAFIRTSASPYNVYVYQFKDYLNGKEAHSAWHKWVFSPEQGVPFGVSSHNGKLLVLSRREGHVIVDTLELDYSTAGRPHLDSMTQGSGVAPTSGYTAEGRGGGYAGASSLVSGLTGWRGILFPSYFDLPAPYLQDESRRPLMQGDMTVQSLRFRLKDTGGLSYALTVGGDVTREAIRSTAYPEDLPSNGNSGPGGGAGSGGPVVVRTAIDSPLTSMEPWPSPGGEYGYLDLGPLAQNFWSPLSSSNSPNPEGAGGELTLFGLWPLQNPTGVNVERQPNEAWTFEFRLKLQGTLPEGFTAASAELGWASFTWWCAPTLYYDGAGGVRLGDSQLGASAFPGSPSVALGSGLTELTVVVSCIAGVRYYYLNGQLAHTEPGWVYENSGLPVNSLRLLAHPLNFPCLYSYVRLRLGGVVPGEFTPASTGYPFSGALVNDPPRNDSPGWPSGLTYTPTVQLPAPTGPQVPVAFLPTAPAAVEERELGEADYALQDPATEVVTELANMPDAVFTLPILAKRGEYSVRVGSHLWAPLTITQIEYVGRYFNNIRRV